MDQLTEIKDSTQNQPSKFGEFVQLPQEDCQFINQGFSQEAKKLGAQIYYPPDYIQILFGQPRKLHENKNNKVWRGYIMIDPEEMKQALKILIELGKTHKELMLPRVEFKYAQTNTPNSRRNQYGMNRSMGDDAPIVVYGDSQQEILDLFKALTKFNEWAEIEQARNKRWGDNVGKKPWKGSFRFRDENGREYTTLEYNEKAGHSTEQK